MADPVSAAGHDVAPPPRSLTETELFIIQQVRCFKALHPASPLFGRRIASLIGQKWDEPLKQMLDDLVRRQWLTHTVAGGYVARVCALSRPNERDEDEGPHDTGAFAPALSFVKT
jgi:hypothetical protein